MARLHATFAVLPFSLVLGGSPLAHTARVPVVSGPPMTASARPARRIKPKKAKRQPIVPKRKPSVVVKRRTRWLAQIIQAEAGDQSFNTKLAVGDVVLNRVRSGIFPASVRAVILQPSQFQPVATGTFFSAIPTPTDWRVARFALQGWNIVPKALYFFNPSLYAGGWMNGLRDCVGHGQMLFCAAPTSTE